SWLVEWALSHRLDSGLEVGLAGYDAWQLEADTGAGNNNKAERHAAGLELGYRWPDTGLQLKGAVYHEYSVKAGSGGVQPSGNLFRLALTTACWALRLRPPPRGQRLPEKFSAGALHSGNFAPIRLS